MKVLDGISASEGFLAPPQERDRDCLDCGAVFATDPHPLRDECNETVDTDEPVCHSCCAQSDIECEECALIVAAWLTSGERSAA